MRQPPTRSTNLYPPFSCSALVASMVWSSFANTWIRPWSSFWTELLEPAVGRARPDAHLGELITKWNAAQAISDAARRAATAAEVVQRWPAGKQLGTGALAETNRGGARAADAVFDELEGDLVADRQLVEGAEGRVAAVEEDFAALVVADESVTLAGVDANDPAARLSPRRGLRLVRFTGAGGRLGPLNHPLIMTHYWPPWRGRGQREKSLPVCT